MRAVHRGPSFVSFYISIGFGAVALALVACGYEAKTVPMMGMSGTPVAGSGNSTATTGSSMTSGSSTATAGSGSSASSGFGGSGDVVGMIGTPGGTGTASGLPASGSGTTGSGMSSGSGVGAAKNPNLAYTKETDETRVLADDLAVVDMVRVANICISLARDSYET